jgi:hypothetical protein
MDLLLYACFNTPDRHFPVNGKGCFRTNDGTNCTSGAALRAQVGWVVAFGSKAIHIEADYLLWAGINTQIAALAVKFIYFYPSLYGHSISSNNLLKPKTQTDIYYLHYQHFFKSFIVLTVTVLEIQKS